MAGEIFLKEGTIATIANANGASLTNGSATSAGTIDLRAAGTSGIIQNLEAYFELLVQWATITGIVANLPVAEVYLLPAPDGTNYPDVDTTAGASVIGYQFIAGIFVANKAPSASTNMRFVSEPIDIRPLLHTVYVKNVSGQTMAANWTLKAMSHRAQYT